MFKCLPACAAACLVCLPAAVDARAVTFRQYREATTCVLFGGELLLAFGPPEWLDASEPLPGSGVFRDVPARGPFQFRGSPAPPRVDHLTTDALCERCRLVEQCEHDRERAAMLNVDCQVAAAQPIGLELSQSGGAMMDSLIAFDSPALGARRASAAFADVSSDPGLLLRLAVVLAVGCFPPLLRDYTQRPLTA